MPAQVEGPVQQGLHAAHVGHGLARGLVLHDHGEAVAGKAAGHVGRFDRRGDALRRRAHQIVAVGGAQGLVDLFQAVDVQRHHGVVPGQRPQVQQALDALEAELAVVQPGQRVRQPGALHLQVQGLAAGDVAQGGAHIGRAALSCHWPVPRSSLRSVHWPGHQTRMAADPALASVGGLDAQLQAAPGVHACGAQLQAKGLGLSAAVGVGDARQGLRAAQKVPRRMAGELPARGRAIDHRAVQALQKLPVVRRFGDKAC